MKPASSGRRIGKFNSALSTSVLIALMTVALVAQKGPTRPEAIRKFPASETIARPPVKTAFNRTLLETANRPAVMFKPFAMVDPKTNKPIAPTSTITLPNGKKPTAQQYYGELNTLEKWLSEHGYSLHDTRRGTTIKLHEVKLDRTLLDRQIQLAPKATSLVKRANFIAVYSDKNLSAPQPLHLSTAHVALSKIPESVPGSKIDETNRQLAGVSAVQRDGLVISNLGAIARLQASKSTPALSNAPSAQTQLQSRNAQLNQTGSLSAQQKNNSAANAALAAKAQADKVAAQEAAQQNAIAKAEAAQAKAAASGGVNCKTVKDDRNWNWDVGNPSSFRAYVSGTLSIGGDACKPPNMQNFDANVSHFNVSTEAKAGGSVFGAGGDILRITTNLGGTQANNNVTAGLGVFVLGQNILNVNKSVSAHFGVESKIDKGIDFSSNIPIPVGPFDINVTIGARGEAGLEYSLSLYPMSISLSGGPYVHASVYAQGGLNLVVAEAGVGITMTLLNYDMNLGGSAGVGWLFAFYVYDDVYADSTLSMLSGNAYVYAKVYYPCLDPFPDICDSQFQTSLWSWPGLVYNSVTFDAKNVIPLKW
jgi:hypothetical protein